MERVFVQDRIGPMDYWYGGQGGHSPNSLEYLETAYREGAADVFAIQQLVETTEALLQHATTGEDHESS